MISFTFGLDYVGRRQSFTDAFVCTQHLEWNNMVGTNHQSSLHSSPNTSILEKVLARLIVVGDTIYFSAASGGTGAELWAYTSNKHWCAVDIRTNYNMEVGLQMGI